ncbi:MAG: pyruvate, water dikinase regulatory protein [Woeseiaceae bacterium]
MKNNMNNTRAVFFVSNSTCITVETLGRSLLYQFKNTQFESHSLRFIDTQDKAKEAVALINRVAQSTNLRPIILSTLIDPALRETLETAKGRYLDIFNAFISPIEEELGCEAKLGLGRVHGIGDEDYYGERMEAVNYTLKTDDGVAAKDYAKADVILTGASRTGKTPTSLYLAMHYGLKAANYPITDEELDSHQIPKALQAHADKLFGLIVSPERLHNIRSKRRANSEYASLPQCQYEIRQTTSLFQQRSIAYFDVSNMSIEEVSSTIMDTMKLKTRTF